MRKSFLIISLIVLLFVTINPVFAGRYYIPEIGRWATPDPALQTMSPNELVKFQGGKLLMTSPYCYAFNNPLVFVDPDGYAAWEVTSEWDDETIKKYREYASQQAEEYAKSGSKATCEDFALNVLIDFASQNGLNISIKNQSGTFSASSDDYSNIADFRTDVLSTTGASDLQNSSNTLDTKLSNAQSGDVLLKRNDSGVATHVQLVTSVSANTIGIHQGNSGILAFTPGASRFLGASNPSSIFYTGKPIQTGVYNRSTGNYTRSGVLTPNAIIKFNLQAKTWNFRRW